MVIRQDILLVEDDADARIALTLLLEHHGYQVRSAANGYGGLEEAARQTPDLVITDLSMPGLTGLEMLAQFRSLPGLADVPVMVVSGQRDINNRVAGFDLGADDFLAKPVQVEDLLARIRRLLVRSERVHEVARLSMVDELTGVLNRRGISNFFTRELERTAVGQTTVAVILVDLNDFKRINDIHGHAAGDTMLCAVTRGLQDALRATDRVGRIGGDEFVVVLSQVDRASCEELAARVRQISPVVFELAPEVILRVGLSLGIAAAQPGDPFEDVLARADAAMYLDKQRQKMVSDSLVGWS
ncbi:MAG: response regulator receiver modulated diguanylate cyclase [Myxococcaceae bacterium]|nr:response regulator receiver modulated diguanylate cyclase [Myxococcaceae bacterium]